MDLMNAIVGSVNGLLWGKILMYLLILLGILFTLKSGFIQFRLLGDMFRLIVGKLPALKDGEQKNQDKFLPFKLSVSVWHHTLEQEI